MKEPPPCLAVLLQSEQIQISLRLAVLEDPSIISRSWVSFYSIIVFYPPPPFSVISNLHKLIGLTDRTGGFQLIVHLIPLQFDRCFCSSVAVRRSHCAQTNERVLRYMQTRRLSLYRV